MVERQRVGTGITARIRETRSINSRSSPAELAEFNKTLSTYSFEDELKDLELHCSRTLTGAGLPGQLGSYKPTELGWEKIEPNKFPAVNENHCSLYRLVLEVKKYEEDSDPGYAARILTCLGDMRREILKGNFEGATEYAFRAGCLVCERDMKAIWETFALRGRKIGMAGKDNFASSNMTRKTEANDRWEPIQQAAERIKREHPHLKPSDVIRRVKKEFKLPFAERTIRERVAKKLDGPA